MADKKKKNQNRADHDFRGQDSKNRTSMLNAAQIDEPVPNPPKKDRAPKKRTRSSERNHAQRQPRELPRLSVCHRNFQKFRGTIFARAGL